MLDRGAMELKKGIASPNPLQALPNRSHCPIAAIA